MAVLSGNGQLQDRIYSYAIKGVMQACVWMQRGLRGMGLPAIRASLSRAGGVGFKLSLGTHFLAMNVHSVDRVFKLFLTGDVD